MSKKLLILSLCVPLLALGNNEIPQPIIDTLSKFFPHHEPNATYIEIGDLTGDGVDDVVTLLGDPQYNKHEEQDPEIKIAVLIGVRNNGYKLLALSPELAYDSHIFYFLRIQKQSLYLLTSGRDWSVDYQFKMRDGELVLIGEESTEFGPDVEKKPFIRESFNFLTGEALYSVKSEKGYKEKRGRFKTGKPVKLTDFYLNEESFRITPEYVEYR
jgi:hypothetical protein